MIPRRPAFNLFLTVAAVIGAFGTLANGVMTLVGEATFLGLPTKWANLMWSVVLVTSCGLWVWQVHKPYRDFCDHKKRRVRLYKHIAELEEEAAGILRAVEDIRNWHIPNTADNLDQIRSRLVAWCARLKDTFDGTDWEAKFAKPLEDTNDLYDLFQAVAPRLLAIDVVKTKLDDSARD